MRVQDIMSEGIEVTTPKAPADDAWALMKQRGIQHLVVRDGQTLVGLLSARDAGGDRGAAIRRGRTVEELMTRGVVTVAPTDTVRKAANTMRGRSIGSVVVIDAGRPVGIITVSDLLDVLGHGGDRGVAQRPLLHHRVPHRKRHVSTGPW
jgi:CBS domain-containing protein